MKIFTRYGGILLIIIGTVALIFTRMPQLSTHNSLLLTGLLCIVAGIWLHIHSIKRDSLY